METNDPVKIAWNLVRLGNFDEFQKYYNQHSNEIPINSLICDPNFEQQSLIHVAASSNSKKTLEFLVSQGANVTFRNYNGFSALHFAAFTGSLESLSYLLNLMDDEVHGDSKHRKIDIEIRTIDGKTPLHIAAMRGHLPVVEKLVFAGADVNACDHQGSSPLIEAIICNHRNVAEYLIKEGADKYHMTAEKITPSLAANEYKRTWFKIGN